jgi:acyl-CoA synthetase (AMP-forming)/AMP-acid ligase II
VLDAVVREKVTRVSMWPQQYKPLFDLAASRGIDITPTMKMGPPLKDGPDGKALPPGRRISTLLGMTETWGPHGAGTWYEELEEKNGASAGGPVRGIERKIVDPATGKELPRGQDGELYVRGFSLMAGYYKRERADSFAADGWFPTGDTCSMNEDGHIYFRGRVSDMIKTAGANVSPTEVEALMLAYQGVAEAIVLGLPDKARGERVVAVVVAKQNEAVDPEALLKRMREEISAYKVPKQIVVMQYDEVPRTSSAKVQRPQLKALLAARSG